MWRSIGIKSLLCGWKQSAAILIVTSTMAVALHVDSRLWNEPPPSDQVSIGSNQFESTTVLDGDPISDSHSACCQDLFSPDCNRSDQLSPSQRRQTNEFLLMMQGMAGIPPEDSRWIQSQLFTGFQPAPMPCCGPPGSKSLDDEHACCVNQKESIDWMNRVPEKQQSYARYNKQFAGMFAHATGPAESGPTEIEPPPNRLSVTVLPKGTDAGTPPEGIDFQDESVKHYRVAALGARVVYNRFSADQDSEDFGGFDPVGQIYVLEEDVQKVLAGQQYMNGGHDPLFFGAGRDGKLLLKNPRTGNYIDKDLKEFLKNSDGDFVYADGRGPVSPDKRVPVMTVEPLVLRANQGDTVVLDFTNRLPGTSSPVNVIRGISQLGNRWDVPETTVTAGDIIQWKMGTGPHTTGGHGVRITNWKLIKNHVETLGSNVGISNETEAVLETNSSTTPDELLLSLRVTSIPSDDETTPQDESAMSIQFDCTVHGPPMNGEISLGEEGSAIPRANFHIQGATYDRSRLAKPEDAFPEAVQPGDPANQFEKRYDLRYIIRIPNKRETQGTYYLHSRPYSACGLANDPQAWTTLRNQTKHGLFGAFVVEPPNCRYLDSYAYSLKNQDGNGGYAVDSDGYVEIDSGWAAIIQDKQTKECFREHVIFFHDDLDDVLDQTVTQQPRALSYRFEGFDEIFTKQNGAGHFAVNDRTMAYSAYTYGDSSTPHPQFYVGDPMRYRIVHSGLGDQFHVFHHHAHRWRFQPGLKETGAKNNEDNLTSPSKFGLPERGEQLDLTASVSSRIDSQTLGPGETFDVEMEGGAGGTQRTVGDALLHCHIIEHVTQGMWTYARIYNTLQTPDRAYMPGLAPLPDRLEENSRPPIAVDSTKLAELVKAGNGPVPVTGPLTGIRITDVDKELYGFLEEQLPPPGVPDLDRVSYVPSTAEDKDLTQTNRADKWDWLYHDFNGRRLYLGEPYDVPDFRTNRSFAINAMTLRTGTSRVNHWEPGEVVVRPGDTIEWILQSGFHGIEFDDWKCAQKLFDVQSGFMFSEETGVGEATNIAGTLLLRVKVKDCFPQALYGVDYISYSCVVHGAGMSGRLWLRDPYVHFGAGFPTRGEGLGVRRPEIDPGIRDLNRPRLLFNPKDGRLAYPHLLPNSSKRPPFAPRTHLVKQADDTWVAKSQEAVQGTTFLGPKITKATDKLGHATGGGLAPYENRPIKRFEIVALDLPIDYSTRSGKPVVDSEDEEYGFGKLPDDETDTDGFEEHNIGTQTNSWEIPKTLGGLSVGDIVEWRVSPGTGKHGLDFSAPWNNPAVPDSDETVGHYLKKLDGAFNPNAEQPMQGIDSTVGGGLLLRAEVLDVPTSSLPIRFNCTVHPGSMRGQLFVPANPHLDTHGQIFVLKEDVPDIMAGRKPREPLILRVNQGDVVDIILSSALEDNTEADRENFGYSKVGMHVHLVQYDAQSSDGAVGGLNYETSIRPSLRFDHQQQKFVSLQDQDQYEETVHYRWWADTELGMVYFHDHSLLKNSLPHGLVGAVVVEPAKTTFHDPLNGKPIYTPTVEPGGVQRITKTSPGTHGITLADIRNPATDLSFREFVPVYIDNAKQNDSISLRYAPLLSRYPTDNLDPLRGGLVISWQGGRPRLSGGKSTAWSSRLHGDPSTPIWRAHPDDPLRIRVEGGGTNQIHSFGMTGHRWRYEAGHPMSLDRNFGLIGISEAFTFNSQSPGRSISLPGDYFYGSSGAKDTIIHGKWGLFRVQPLVNSNVKARRAKGLLHIYLRLSDQIEGIEVKDTHTFVSPTGVKYHPTQSKTIDLDDLKTTARFGDTNIRYFELEVESADPGDQGNVPIGTSFGVESESNVPVFLKMKPNPQFDEPWLVLIESSDPFTDGRTVISRLRNEPIPGNIPPEDRTILRPAPLPRDDIERTVFHVAALEVRLPDPRNETPNDAFNNPPTDQHLLAYVHLQGESEIDHANDITALARLLGENDNPTPEETAGLNEQIDQLRELLRKRFEANPEPLILRVDAPENPGQSKAVEVRLINLLPTGKELTTRLENSSNGKFPFGQPYSELTSLNAGLVQYNVRDSQGSAFGLNRHTLVPQGDSRRYLWKVDRELGVCLLQDLGDPHHRLHGLVGALIVEPAGTTIAQQTNQSQVTLQGTNGNFREFVIFLHDHFREDSTRPALNYRRQATAIEPEPPHFVGKSEQLIRVRLLHAAGDGGARNHSFFLEGAHWGFDPKESPGFPSNRISTVTTGPGAAYNIQFTAEKTEHPRRYVYGSRVAIELINGAWGQFTVRP